MPDVENVDSTEPWKLMTGVWSENKGGGGWRESILAADCRTLLKHVEVEAALKREVGGK